MKNKPINKEAFAYVSLFAKKGIKLKDFIPIEFFVAKKIDLLYPNGLVSDTDLLQYVYKQLNKNKISISPSLIKEVVKLLYTYLFEQGTLLPLSLSLKIEEWGKWREVIKLGIHLFIERYSKIPNLIHLSHYTNSQINLVSGNYLISSYYWDSFSLPFHIDTRLEDKILIFEYTEDDNNSNLKNHTSYPSFTKKVIYSF